MNFSNVGAAENFKRVIAVGIFAFIVYAIANQQVREPAIEATPGGSPAAAVATRPVDFTGKDMNAIVEASRTNELRFNRDYKDKVFSEVLPFKSVTEKMIGSGYLVNFDGVYCFTNKEAALRMIEWRKGHFAKVTGLIHNTTLGDIWLENCSIHED